TKLLADFDARPRFVLPLRHPLEVAASLKKRGGTLVAKSAMLWLRHSLNAEHGTRGYPRSFIAYSRLLQDPVAEMERVGREIEMTWPRCMPATWVEVESYLADSLRHHREDETALRRHSRIHEWVVRAYDLLTSCIDGDSPETRTSLDALRQEVDVAETAYAPLLADRDRTAKEARTAAAAGEGVVASLKEAVETEKNTAAALGAEVVRLTIELEQFGAAVAHLNLQLEQSGSTAAEAEARAADAETAAARLQEQSERTTAEAARRHAEDARLLADYAERSVAAAQAGLVRAAELEQAAAAADAARSAFDASERRLAELQRQVDYAEAALRRRAAEAVRLAKKNVELAEEVAALKKAVKAPRGGRRALGDLRLALGRTSRRLVAKLTGRSQAAKPPTRSRPGAKPGPA
ncbi:MAG: hypothetical protein ACRC1K_12725, partial [Planctomycetia bacterium]